MIKSKDIFALVFIVALSGLISFFASNFLFGSQKSLSTQVEVVDPISSAFNYENKLYFGPDKLNPTKDITVSQNNNVKPLGQ